MNTIQNGLTNSELSANTAVPAQAPVQNQSNMKKIVGITLLAVAIILFVGAMIASVGAAVGFLPLGIPIMQSFISAAPPVLIPALYFMQDGPAKIDLSVNGIKYTVDDAKTKGN